MLKAQALLATALFSAASLILEISLTRVFSFLLTQSFVFLILAVAVLGIALGAALVALIPALHKQALSLWLLLASFSTVLVFTVIVFINQSIWLLMLLSMLPYFFLGIVLAVLFATHSAQSRLLYGVDLLGAGLGVGSSLFILNQLGGLNSLLLVALLLALAALIIEKARAFELAATGLILLLCTVGFTVTINPEILVAAKPMQERLQAGGVITETRWDAFTRTDLIYQEAQNAYYLYMDGGAGSVIPDASRPQLWLKDIGSFPFFALEPSSALLIGAGGGLDVALAKQVNVQDISVVEVNKASIDIVKSLESYASNLYNAPVKVFHDEGRSVLRRQGISYDLIFLSQVITQASEARGLVLAENKLYTTEAFHDYLTHLTPNGAIALKLYDELTLTRAFLTAVQALAETGLSEAQASKHLFALLDISVTPAIPLLVVTKKAFQREEVIRLARIAEAQGYAFLFLPDLLANPPLDALSQGQTSLEAIINSATDVNLRPVTDNKPFFYQFETGLPRFMTRLLTALASLLVFGITLFAVKQTSLTSLEKPLLFIYALLGFGFMAIEIQLLQKTQLLLGHPTLALVLVLAVLLIGSGLGSLLANQIFSQDPLKGILYSSAAVIALWLTWTLQWPALESMLQTQALLPRASLTAVSFLPLALALGMPFPLALSLNENKPRLLALAWVINGVATVMGSVATTAISLSLGFQQANLLALAYLAICLLLIFNTRAKQQLFN